MNELEELRKRILDQDYIGALKIVDELDEMSLDDKLNKIYSYMVILLIHLIKQEAEQRTTKSWDRSIDNSVDKINLINKRRKAGGYYANKETLNEITTEAYPKALKEASYEAFEGKYNVRELSELVDSDSIKTKAIALLDFGN